MPLDSIMWSNEQFARRCIGWQLKFSLWPRRCFYTGKYLWFKLAYKGTAMITGPGDVLFEYRWHDKNAHIIWMLTR